MPGRSGFYAGHKIPFIYNTVQHKEGRERRGGRSLLPSMVLFVSWENTDIIGNWI